MGPILFNTFINVIDSGNECTLSKSAEHTNLSGAADMLEGRDTMQRDLDWLQDWAHMNFMKFKMTNCKVLHMSHSNPQY